MVWPLAVSHSFRLSPVSLSVSPLCRILQRLNVLGAVRMAVSMYAAVGDDFLKSAMRSMARRRRPSPKILMEILLLSSVYCPFAAGAAPMRSRPTAPQDKVPTLDQLEQTRALGGCVQALRPVPAARRAFPCLLLSDLSPRNWDRPQSPPAVCSDSRQKSASCLERASASPGLSRRPRQPSPSLRPRTFLRLRRRAEIAPQLPEHCTAPRRPPLRRVFLAPFAPPY